MPLISTQNARQAPYLYLSKLSHNPPQKNSVQSPCPGKTLWVLIFRVNEG